MTVYTTLNKIRAFEPCKDGWGTLLSSLGKTEPDDEPLALVYILESNGLGDALWCTRTLFDEHREKIVQYAIRCAENVLPIFEEAIPDDLRPRLAIQAAKDYLEGKIANMDFWPAAWAAEAAAWAAADAAKDAAAAAAAAAADASVWAASADASAWADAAVRAAAWAAAEDAAIVADAAKDAARATEEKFQEGLFREIFGEVQP